MIIKLVYNTEIHLIKLQDPSLEQLQQHVVKLHPQITQNYILQYLDNENDLITISSNEDLVVLFENLNNQQIKVIIKPSNTWTCQNCTFENKNSDKCEACEMLKNQPQPNYGGYQPQMYNYPIQNPPPMGPPPQMPPHPMGPPMHPMGPSPFMQYQQMMCGPGHPPYHQFGFMYGHHHHGHHFHHRKAQFKALMKNPQFAQQKAQLKQLAKEVAKAFITTQQQNQQQQMPNYQYWQQPLNQDDYVKIQRLAEVLQCTQEQAREYFQLFRHLTLDEIVLMIENAE